MPSSPRKVKQQDRSAATAPPDSHAHTTPPPAGRGLWRSTMTVGAMTTLSRICGFIRDIILANLFGASGHFDAFIIAFKIPNFFRRIFAEGAFSQAFVPVFSEYQAKHGAAASRVFVQHVAGSMACGLLLLVALGELAAPALLTIFAPGFVQHAQHFALTQHMLHITFPYILLIAFTALAAGILNSHRQFSIPAFTPVLLNLSLIGVACLWAPHTKQPIITLAWAVPIGGILQLALQLPSLRKIKHLAWPKLNWQHPGVKQVMKLMLPAIFGVSVAQISLMVDNMFASFLPAGSISWLYYSDRLTYLPLGVIGVAIATVILPQLSQLHVQQSRQHFVRTYQWAIRSLLLVGLPAALGLLLLATPILCTLFQHGAFTFYSVQMSARSLRAFALGLPAFMLIKVLASSFYAQKNVKTPVKIAAVAMLCNILLNIALIHALAHAGLALATSIAAWLNAALLAWKLFSHHNTPANLPPLTDHSHNPATPHNQLTQQATTPNNAQHNISFRLFCLRLLFSCICMSTYIFYLKPSDSWWQYTTTSTRIFQLCFLLLPAIGIYACALWASGMRKHHLHTP